MPLDFTDPHTYKYFNEYYEHQRELQAAWYRDNMDKIKKYATFTDSHKGYSSEDILRMNIEPCMPSMTKQHEVSYNYRRKKPLRDGPILGISQLKHIDEEWSTSIMKPVEPNISQVHCKYPPEGGRRPYLKARRRKNPEEKYNYCMTSNNVYGWRLQDSSIPIHRSICKRYNNFETRSIAQRAAIKPDPDYYQPLPKYPFFNCPVKY